MADNWALVEQVQELVKGSRPVLIDIVKTEEPASDDGSIRIISTPAGELQRRVSGMVAVEVGRQSVAEIIDRNYRTA